MNNTYQHSILVKFSDLDAMNHVNNVVYVQWVQDAATAHWISGASEAIKDKFNWVVIRHEVDYRSPAVLNDELIAKTWVEDYDGAKSNRRVQIIRKKDNRVLAEAKTTWCLLAAANNRPVRVGQEIKEVFRASSAEN